MTFVDWLWIAFATFVAGVAIEALVYRLRRRDAESDAEKAMANPFTKDGERELRALLAVRGHLLTKDQRGECLSWLAEKESPHETKS